ncbi:hypothetical protein DQ04_08051000, partial [Trypanosoma grayi]|uniref:hypothetical protein n=1 Tax=Trypanosoma grayi TaxID=71804 RepID=UPI0004F471FD
MSSTDVQGPAMNGANRAQAPTWAQTCGSATAGTTAAAVRPARESGESAAAKMQGANTLTEEEEKKCTVGAVDTAAACGKETKDTQQSSYAQKVRSVADQYVVSGKKVLDDAKTSAEAYQQAAKETVQNTAVNGRQRVEACAATVKSTMEPLVDGAKQFADKSTRRYSETRDTLLQRATTCVEAADSV